MHTHTTSSEELDSVPTDHRARIVMTGIVVLIAAATLLGLVLLWPGHAARSGAQAPGSADGAETSATAPDAPLLKATITSVDISECDTDPGDGCARARATVNGQDTSLYLASEAVATRPAPGDHIKVAESGKANTVVFVDYDRTVHLGLLAALCAVIVVAVARFRGLRALVGLFFAFAVVTVFLLPALLAGEPAPAVGASAAGLIMLVVMYLAHGVNMRTTAALLGTAGGIGLTMGLAVLTTGSAHLGGLFSDDTYILATSGHLNPNGIVICSILIAGLGALNDVTITQAAAVWELRAAAPGMRRREVFSAAMRIGRDHIASSVYTVAFVLVGGALATLLVLGTSGRPLLQQLTLGEQAVEIAGILVCLIGLVAAVPVTTAIAAAAVARRGALPQPQQGPAH